MHPTPTAPVLVVSCDAYADLWPPFFSLFRKQWPDCPYRVYLGANHRTYPDPRVTTLCVGDDLDWATSVRRMLDHLDSDYVIMLLEDFLIDRPVDSAGVERLLGLARQNHVGCLRLSPHPPPFIVPCTPVPGVAEVSEIAPGLPYRVSAQAAIWRVDVLQALLVPGFSPWEFELVGSELSRAMAAPFWESARSTIVYDHGVEKGRWKPAGLEICRRHGVAVDLAARGSFDESDLAAYVGRLVALRHDFELRQAALAAFKRGRRTEGMRAALRLLARRPLAPSSWTLLVAALGGTAAIERIERFSVARKVRRAGRRHQRSLASR